MFSEESKLTDSFADRWARRFLYALIVLEAVPFFGIPTGLEWPGLRRFNFYKLIIIVLLLGLLSARLDRVRAALRSKTKLIALCAALAIWVGLFLGSISYGPGLRSNLEIFLLYWTPSLLVFAYLLLLFPATRRRSLALSLAGFYALALVLGYFEWLTWKIPAFDNFFLQFREVPHERLGEFLRVGGALGSMGLAEAILIGLPIVIGFALESFKERRWAACTLAFAHLHVGLILLLRSFVRHAVIACLLEFFAFTSLLFPARRKRGIMVATVCVALVSISLTWGLIIAQGHGRNLLARYLPIAGRAAAYEVSWQIIRDWPWTGIGMGPDGFAHYWKNFGPSWWSERRDYPLTHAHNFYVQMFVSGGLLAGLGFLCLVLLILRKGWRVWRRGRLSGDPQLSPVEIGVLTAVVGVFVSMLLDFKYNLQWSTLILWVLLGTVILILDRADQQGSTDAATGEKPAETARES